MGFSTFKLLKYIKEALLPISSEETNELSNLLVQHSTLWFSNLASAFLFEFEESGQISDGKYENANPDDHYNWLWDAEIIIDPTHIGKSIRVFPYKSGRNYFSHYSLLNTPKKYNIRDLFKYDVIKSRCLNFGRFGKSLENATLEKFDKFNCEAMRTILEQLPEEKKYDDIDDFYESIVDQYTYMNEYVIKASSIFTQKEYDNFYNTTYSLAELKYDCQLMDNTVNRCYCKINYKI